MDGRSLLRWEAHKSQLRTKQLRRISLDEVAQHCTQDDAWIILFNKVYDISHFMHFHPGGLEVLLPYAGKDGTDAFSIEAS
jgi:cytochrome b5